MQIFSGHTGCAVVGLKIQPDHVHRITVVVPKLLILALMVILNGRTAIRGLKLRPFLIKETSSGDHFSAPTYCVDAVGLDAESIRKYFKYREKNEHRQERLRL
jgi:REP element-mobilizing transposase RayT